MKELLSTLMLASMLIACSEGDQKDTHGCSTSLGQRYSFLKQTCVKPFEIADIKLETDQNKKSVIYVILSEDRSQAEIFATDLPENTILDGVKGGYLSKDNKIRLIKTAEHWKLNRE